MKGLRGRAVLVTGASSGIGWETALAFAERGCRLGLAARRAEKLDALAALARERGGEAFAVACDVREAAQAKAAVDETARRFGRLDILINNAGIQDTAAFDKQTPEKLEDIFRTNLLGAVFALQAALAHMRPRGEGHIVNVASIAGLFGMPYMAAYCASKFALVGLTEALRRELYGTGIFLTAFCPGTVDTPMVHDAVRDPVLAKAIRPLSARTIAEKIVWAVEKGAPEVVIGELSGTVINLTRFFTRLTDWATHQVVRRVHPVARREDALRRRRQP